MEDYWPLIRRHLEHHAIKEITLSCQNLLFRFAQLGQTLFEVTFLNKYEFNPKERWGGSKSVRWFFQGHAMVTTNLYFIHKYPN